MCIRDRHQTDIKVIRIFNTYGPRMHPNDGRVVSNFVVSNFVVSNFVVSNFVVSNFVVQARPPPPPARRPAPAKARHLLGASQAGWLDAKRESRRRSERN